MFPSPGWTGAGDGHPARGRQPRPGGGTAGAGGGRYPHYDNPAGARFRVSNIKPTVASSHLHPSGPGLFTRHSVLGVREAAGLWHPPGAGDETHLVARAGSRALVPSAKGISAAALMGETSTGPARQIHFPQNLLRRHHLYVARTRIGKSTLMEHVIAHKLREKAAGDDPDAIIVVDPHAALVGSVLAQVPESLIDSMKLINLADRRGFPGINLPDTRIFADRDRTADSVVRVAHGLWEQWGPRMQSILGHAVKSLHEANGKRQPEAQYTILDGLASSPTSTSGTRPWDRLTTTTCSDGGPGIRKLAAGLSGHGPGPGADQVGLLCIVKDGPGHPGPAPLHHRPAETIRGVVSCWCPPPRAPWVGTWPRW